MTFLCIFIVGFLLSAFGANYGNDVIMCCGLVMQSVAGCAWKIFQEVKAK